MSSFIEMLEEPFSSGILTHHGPLVQRLEVELARLIGVPQLSLLTNGTIAIQCALKALDLKGEVITTPFTWAATPQAIRWQRLKPVFADIDPETFNLDPEAVCTRITENTCAIMPVHVFGNPCDHAAIEDIALKFGLKVIYDAAHAFGVAVEGQSVLLWGDVSATSFHCTKIFSTAEGGGCVSKDAKLLKRIESMRFFGFNQNKEITDEGLNAKMTEIHAALGLASLDYFKQSIQLRKAKTDMYRSLLSSHEGVRFQKYHDAAYNYAYMPVVLEKKRWVPAVQTRLKQNGIDSRPYFSPSLNRVALFGEKAACPNSDWLADHIICLPLYPQLKDSEVELICALVIDTLV